MKFLFAVLLVLHFARGDLTRDEASKKSLKELRAFLSDRGQTCTGCTEKADFVDAAVKAAALPLKKTPPKAKAKEEQPDIQKILEEAGLAGKFKVYGRDDIEKMAKAFGEKEGVDTKKNDDEEL